MRHMWITLLLCIFVTPAMAIVDMRNANYSETWIDIDASSGGFDLKIQRTYNSRSVYNGMFGFGWCSDYETKLSVTAQNTLRVTECGAGLNVEYSLGNAKSTKSVNALVADIMKEVQKRNKGQSKAFFDNLEKQIRTDELLRDEFAKQLNMGGKIAKGKKYYADGRTNDWIELRGSNYVRSLPSGTVQKFSKSGQLIEVRDTSSNFLKLSYSGNKLSKIVDNAGSSLQFRYGKNSNYVSDVIGPNNLKVAYKYSGEKLVLVKNAFKNTYKYQYDDLYNMVRVDYPDNTHVKLTYNKDKDWVTSFRDREGCVETYDYGQDSKDPLNKYSSSVQKKCKGKVTNKSQYEFVHRIRKDGSRYLAQSKSVINGDTSITEYHPIHGRPTKITKNSRSIRYTYYKTGLLKARYQDGQETNYTYKGSCQKPSEVRTKLAIRVPQQGRKPSKTTTKTITTRFKYQPRTCLLSSAVNSEGQSASVEYDRTGKIRKIVDQSKRVVNITYDKRFGKPLVVERPGLGKIRFNYKSNGELNKIESDDEPLVAVQVANMFSNLLEIIAPGTTETPI